MDSESKDQLLHGEGYLAVRQLNLSCSLLFWSGVKMLFGNFLPDQMFLGTTLVSKFENNAFKHLLSDSCLFPTQVKCLYITQWNPDYLL